MEKEIKISKKDLLKMKRYLERIAYINYMANNSLIKDWTQVFNIVSNALDDGNHVCKLKIEGDK